jgi:hypothetical protein
MCSKNRNETHTYFKAWTLQKNEQLVTLSIFCLKIFWSYFFQILLGSMIYDLSKMLKYLHFGSVSGNLKIFHQRILVQKTIFSKICKSVFWKVTRGRWTETIFLEEIFEMETFFSFQNQFLTVRSRWFKNLKNFAKI